MGSSLLWRTQSFEINIQKASNWKAVGKRHHLGTWISCNRFNVTIIVHYSLNSLLFQLHQPILFILNHLKMTSDFPYHLFVTVQLPKASIICLWHSAKYKLKEWNEEFIHSFYFVLITHDWLALMIGREHQNCFPQWKFVGDHFTRFQRNFHQIWSFIKKKKKKKNHATILSMQPSNQ